MRTEATQQQRTYSLVCVISSCVSLLPRKTSWVQCALIFKCFHSLLHHYPPSPLLNVLVQHSSAWSLLPSLWLFSLSTLSLVFSLYAVLLSFPSVLTCVSSLRCWRQVSASWWRRSDSGRCPAAAWARWLQTLRWPVSHEAEGWSRTGLQLPLWHRDALQTTLHTEKWTNSTEISV